MKQQEVTTLESGQVITHHAAEDCQALDVEGSRTYCPLHSPQPGPWQDWPRSWDSARQVVMRQCPCHTLHPASEVYPWSLERGEAWKLVHKCCHHACTSHTNVTPEMANANWQAYLIGKSVQDQAPTSVHELLDSLKQPDPRNLPVRDLTERLTLVSDALDLVVALWPDQTITGIRTVLMDKTDWDRLRRTLLAIPELVEELENARVPD